MGIMKIALLSGAALCMGAVTAQAHAQEPVRTYDLPAQDLATALRTIARGSDYQLVADAKSLMGARAPSLAGAYTVEEAVAALLAPSGLTAEIRDRTITLRGRDAASREEVTGAADVLLSVTGSRIRGAKPTSPVISASREKITELGHSDLGSFARSIPQNFSGGQNPGVISSTQSGSENTTSSSTLNLRGLGPDATLTLLNGHRLAYDAVTQGVDISSIPLAAIERIEVIADGASALYGSDAVAGVANIVLRRSFKGVEASARIGAATNGGNFQQQYGIVTGANWSGGGVMIAGNFNDATDISARQRNYARTVQPSLNLLPSQKRYGGVLAGHQALNDLVEFEIDAHYDHHRSRAAVPFGAADVSQSGVVSTPRVESYSISPSVRFRLPAGWEFVARATRAISNSNIVADIHIGGARFASNQISYKNDLWSAEVSAEGALFSLPGGDARLALGAGLRSNGLIASIQQVTAAASRSLLDYRDAQTATFAYGEIALPLISDVNARPLARMLQLSGALRYERYDSVGGLATPKVGVIYQPVSDFKVKGTWGKSFKAATLNQRNTVQQGYLVSPSNFLPLPATSAPILELFGGSRDLAPEKATTWTITGEFTPSFAPGLRLEGSYFHVRYKDRIVRPIATFSQAFAPQYSDLILYDPTLAQVLAATSSLPFGVENQTGTTYDPANVGAIIFNQIQNAAAQTIKGVDASASYEFTAGKNVFTLEGAGSYLKSDLRLSPNQPVIKQAGTIFNPPHWRARGSANWQRDGVAATLAYNYIGGVTDRRTSSSYEVGSFQSVDASVTLKPGFDGWLSGVTILLAAQNLLDERPAIIRTSSVAVPNYDATNYSSIGRFLSLTVSKSW
ncbi:TonB-dependent receptor domain-containing protein [Sphingobium yanoikuyae]|uniref:TonB-dependent receptor n=1 Tax=Sphingobium yanoikuyae TaxID=13690 RepID=A0A430BQ88_SPHYA|nr:TonB-dependent receptor [Sphingobium yanoikuyae]RSU54894.1 TonB-dependent receptor [Sphingobium yanoikuyae]